MKGDKMQLQLKPPAPNTHTYTNTHIDTHMRAPHNLNCQLASTTTLRFEIASEVLMAQHLNNNAKCGRGPGGVARSGKMWKPQLKGQFVLHVVRCRCRLRWASFARLWCKSEECAHQPVSGSWIFIAFVANIEISLSECKGARNNHRVLHSSVS